MTTLFNHFTALLALTPPPSQPGQQANPTGQMVQMIGMFAIIGVMFYFMFIRPQQKKAKEQTNLLSKLKSNDKVLTSSGLVGIVVSVKDKTVTIRSGEAKLEVLKSTIAEITEASSSES
ncbi:MAG: preprotein translocase subunit YajC [Verrucomicrobia bacterium]|nr:preprotein translocase subunit YajC [Verrucomicrobiota bacterium]